MTFAPTPEQLTGTIESVLAKDVLQQVDNDGDHTYLSIQEECKTQLPVTSESMNITIPLTNPNVDVVCFDKSFITLSVSIRFAVKNYIQPSDDPDTNTKLAVKDCLKTFIGLKHSAECLGEYSIFHNGKQISGTLQSNGTAEAFLYHAIRSQDELTNRKGIYTLAKAAHEYDEASVCGSFVSVKDMKECGGFITVPFTITIPFNDILCFQQFRDYPNALFGKLELKFKFNKNAFVCMTCDPVAVLHKTIHSKWNQLATEEKTQLLYYWKSIHSSHEGYFEGTYDREFTQVGDNFDSAVDYFYSNNEHTVATFIRQQCFTPHEINITECYTTMCGYRINPEKREELREFYTSNPWVKFSQNVNYLPFSAGANSTQLFVNQQTYLNNVTDFVITFPRTQNQITVLKNPMLTDLSITVLNRKYPEMPLDTTSERFAQMMLTASDSFMMSPNREYVQSISSSRGNENGSLRPTEDLTSFVTTLKVERPSAMGMVCDGLNSHGEQVSVRLSAKPKYTGTADEYCAQNPPAPVLYTVNDSYFIFNSKNNGECIYSDKDFNDKVNEFMA